MEKIEFLLMCFLAVSFAACNDDKENPSSENGENGSNSGNGNVSAVSVYKSGTQDGHDYVDLGLTSGTKWATANVGAKTPQDYGNYYAWGEVAPKETYSWDTYKYGTYKGNYDNDYSALTKYNSSDGKSMLDISDDVAYVSWGGKWRMPTEIQQMELSNQCYWVWTDNYNGSDVAGYMIYKAKKSNDKGKKIYEKESPSSSYDISDAHIFLPATFYRNYASSDFTGPYGLYWSSSLSVDALDNACYVFFYSTRVRHCNYDLGRSFGLSVRAVFK
ncbi:MAG: hypothetical protein IJP79_09545 [Paludibacteraceae bacterium]|nr:hypothetical protein [Paludibacteraceae bacterium]